MTRNIANIDLHDQHRVVQKKEREILMYGGKPRSGGGGGYGGRPRQEGPREMTKVKCSDCGAETEVPFKPTEGRPVYCRDCYQKHKPARNDRF